MKSDVLNRFDMPWLPTTAFLIFAAVFVSILWIVLRPKTKSYCDHMAELPLNEK